MFTLVTHHPMDYSWSRIVCYGIGHFEYNPQQERARLERLCKRNDIIIKESTLERLIRSHHVRGVAQLDYLLRLRKLHNVPIFIYDPLFTDTERNRLRALSMHVLDSNLEDYMDKTLYYLPFCPIDVSRTILMGHVIGDQIGFIGNTLCDILPEGESMVRYRTIKVPRTRSEVVLYREQYFVEITKLLQLKSIDFW